MLEALLVGLIVVVATAYAAWALVPASVRLRWATRLAARAGRGGAPTALARLATALELAARRGAGGCPDCGAGQASRPAPPGRPPRQD